MHMRVKQSGLNHLVHKLAEVFKRLWNVLVDRLIALLETPLDARDSSSILLLLPVTILTNENGTKYSKCLQHDKANKVNTALQYRCLYQEYKPYGMVSMALSAN